MAVLPLVKLFFPCAKIEVKQPSNVFVLYNPLHSLVLQDFPEVLKFSFYVQMKEGLGKYNCRIDISNQDGIIIYSSSTGQVEFSTDNRASIFEQMIDLDDWEIKQPGFYDFQLVFNHVVCAQWSLAIQGSTVS